MISRLPQAKKKKSIPWQEKKQLMDDEEIRLQKNLNQLTNWIKMVDSMTDDQLKEYLQNRPRELKTVKIPKVANTRQRVRIPEVEDSKHWGSYGIMASVWKFHQHDMDNDQLLPVDLTLPK